MLWTPQCCSLSRLWALKQLSGRVRSASQSDPGPVRGHGPPSRAWPIAGGWGPGTLLNLSDLYGSMGVST